MADKFLSGARGPALAPPPPSGRDNPDIPIKLCNLPPLNAIANQVIALSADPDIDLTKIASVMEGDPAFAADLLFLANSSLFGFRTKIQAVRHAVAVLGLQRIRGIAITAAMRSYVSKKGQFVPRCWQHSVACAIIAEEIAPIFDTKSDVAYTLGLVHDIGRLGLLKSYPKEYEPLLGNAFENVEEVLNVERSLLKVDHGTAGAWMVKTWGFPEIFSTICRSHHESVDMADSGQLQAVKTSCQLAEAIGHAAINYKNPIAYDEIIQSLPPRFSNRRFPSEADMRTTIEARLKSFTDARF